MNKVTALLTYVHVSRLYSMERHRAVELVKEKGAWLFI